MIHKVRKQDVEGEETCAKEEVVHGVQVSFSYGSEHNQCCEKEEQRNWRKVAHPAGEWTGVEFTGHSHADIEIRDQIVECPFQRPTVIGGRLLRGGDALLREVVFFEVCDGCEREILYRRDAVREAVQPAIQAA